MMKLRFAQRCVLALFVSLLAGCGGEKSGDSRGAAPPVGRTLFTMMPSTYTGVRFENRLEDSRELNVFTYRNYYNGGGVAIGDLSGDGRPEIILTSNLEGTRLYLNLGDFRFRDVTRQAGIEGKGEGSWTTGVTLADVNGDGLLDIYVCYAGEVDANRRANELYVNQGVDRNGVPKFAELAREYGIADEGYTTHATFFDYDRDGDLDLYVLNNSFRPVNSFGMENTRNVRHPYGGDKLYRNDGSGGRVRFTDVSEQAGIFGTEIAFGLGVVVADVNRDGWPDIYVSNDFFERDYLYINNRDGTFKDSLEQQMPYISYFSMGLDIADVDNDAWPDIYVTDMLPEDEYRLKTTSNFEGWEFYQAKVKNGYHHQLMRNMLHRNNGNGTFSELGQMAGVARTDWSWSALIADFDLDGHKDIFVTNGLAKDVTSQDYIAFLASEQTMRSVTNGGARGGAGGGARGGMGGRGGGGGRGGRGGRVDFKKLIDAMTATKLPDYAFRNRGDLTFTNESAAWGLNAPSFSHGAAYGDLDGDGDLDLVVSNVNDEAFVYRSNARAMQERNRYLQVALEGDGSNRFAVGAKVTISGGGQTFFQEQMPSRGFQSSVDYVLTFGLGAIDTVESVKVEWPDGRFSELRNVATNQRVAVKQEGGRRKEEGGYRASSFPLPPSTFLEVTAQTRLPFVHRENAFVDFEREHLMPKMVSTEGPFIAVGDVDSDGLDDMYIGGAKDQPGQLLVQRRDGRFVSTNEVTFQRDRVSEDLGAVFFDANGDGHADLYVVSGGNEFSDMARALQDRLYLNDGRGNFRKAEGHLPAMNISGSRVVAHDFDGDGDTDLFVGGRVVPWRYGMDPRSVLLENDGRGRFRDVTDSVAPGLSRVGMVTDALWRDVDGDRRMDLVLVGEWMPITIFRNTGTGTFQRMNARGLEKSHGWWNSIVAGDFTGDGRVDFVVGNLGLNSRLRASESQPVTMYVKDFDGNGFAEQIISTYNGGVSYPLPLRDDLLRALPSLKARYASYKDYARQTTADVFSQAELQDAVVKQAHTFATSLVRNNGAGSFTLIPLPSEAQLAPVYGILASDFDRDGRLDLLLAGNFDGVKPEIGRLSASYGLYLRGDGAGRFAPVSAAESGFLVRGSARDIQRVRTARGVLYVVARNNEGPLVFELRGPGNGEGGKGKQPIPVPSSPMDSVFSS